MNAALATVAMIRKGERTVAVLGDMLELGDFSAEAHAALGAMVAQQGFDYLCAVGEYAEIMVAAALKGGMTPQTAKHCADKAEAAAFIQGLLASSHLQHNDLVLVKGSRGMRMEQVIAALNPLP
jgi:UDP-N-acetylmuramyl pentapeptide synthase